MASIRVLVMENHRFQRSVLVKMLQHLGVREVLQSGDTVQALAQIQLSGEVDIVLCNLSSKGSDCLDFLQHLGQLGAVRAVALYSEFSPELRRTLGQIPTLCGLQLLGVMSQPLQLRSLKRVLREYTYRPAPIATNKPALLELFKGEELRRGLALGEFRAWFQPKFVLATGALVGVEALVRWDHPTKGVLLPEDFLAAMLAYELIDNMFKQLLEQGLSLLDELRRQGVNIELAFNLHSSQLNGSGLVEHIQQTLERYAIPGSTLMFELAENGLLDLPTRTCENLLRLRLLGCGLSIDDFGVGFSSLKLLCQLPFNQIKLDGEYVRQLDEPCSRAMVGCTLALARSLGMSLVIEGVSSQRICDTLIRMGCQVGQGFYLAPPMTGHDLLQWLDLPVGSC
ncbi:diguanylate phosphodiesterase [Pseudomonas sp. Eqa60]|uniref:EAL domain-containing response regulator n=1 Tax=Pseudomonas sp. Eqa60 TaxID=2799184 RepID=UPI001BF130D3|nr:EAL domain-containing response regulator [Pseudomonas sp. Eqa60]BCQ69803.1 diguanylate phosphodiesterase [Pseudomonas sp. Eqa60]